MTAADAREQLEAEIWRSRRITVQSVIAILAAADAYAQAYAEVIADDRIAGHVANRVGLARLEAAAAETVGVSSRYADQHGHYRRTA